MAIIYKHFREFRIALCALFLCFFCMMAPAQANSIFTVDDVEVDVTGDSAVAAREQAFNEAQAKAFDVLAERMVSGNQADQFVTPDLMIISSLINDYEVVKERLSNVRYIGTYKFRFKPKEVKTFFSQSGVSYTDVAQKQILILPFYQIDGRMAIWSPFNIWMQAWNRYESKSALVPVVIPIGDLDDVQDIGDDNAFNYQQDGLKGLLKRYDTGDAIITIAMPDAELSLVDKPGDPAQGNLQISIYRTDQGRPQLVEDLSVEAATGDMRDVLYDRGVLKVQQVLKQDWKNKTVVASVQNSVIQARVPFANFQQWSDTQRVLKQVVGINEVNLKSLSPKEARIDVVFRGDEQRLRLALKQADITLGQGSFQTNTARSGTWRSGWQNTQNVIYDLYLNRYAPRSAGTYEKRF